MEESLKRSMSHRRGTKQEATTLIQAGNTDTLKTLKHITGGRGRVQRTLAVGSTRVGTEGGTKDNSQDPTWVPGRKMFPSTETANHVGRVF